MWISRHVILDNVSIGMNIYTLNVPSSAERPTQVPQE